MHSRLVQLPRLSQDPMAEPQLWIRNPVPVGRVSNAEPPDLFGMHDLVVESFVIPPISSNDPPARIALTDLTRF